MPTSGPGSTSCAGRSRRRPASSSRTPVWTAQSWSASSSSAKDYAYGFDAQRDEYGDLYKLGIIDPTKVVRTALQDAASVASLLITTEALVAEKPKMEAPAPATPPGGMGY